MKRLHRDYTALALDRGEGMSFHPVTGQQLPDESHRCFDGTLLYVPLGCCGKQEMPRIGDGECRRIGQSYPDHWKFDPYTGRKLLKTQVVITPASHVLTGWELD